MLLRMLRRFRRGCRWHHHLPHRVYMYYTVPVYCVYNACMHVHLRVCWMYMYVCMYASMCIVKAYDIHMYAHVSMLRQLWRIPNRCF